MRLAGRPVPGRPTRSLRSLAPGRPRAATHDRASWRSLRSRGSCALPAALCPAVRLGRCAPSLPAGRGRRHMTTAEHSRGIFEPELLDRCISCGFCLPACPTYALSTDEGSSPRGRITLMRALEYGRLPEDDPRLREESSFCLGCRACEPVCPAGVQYGELLEAWRDHQWRGRHRPLLTWPLLLAVSRTPLVRAMGLFRRHARTARAPADAYLMLGCFERAL